MGQKRDKATRYFIDLDLQTKKIIAWDYGQKDTLVQNLAAPSHQRVFITEGQYNKLERKNVAVRHAAASKS